MLVQCNLILKFKKRQPICKQTIILIFRVKNRIFWRTLPCYVGVTSSIVDQIVGRDREDDLRVVVIDCSTGIRDFPNFLDEDYNYQNNIKIWNISLNIFFKFNLLICFTSIIGFLNFFGKRQFWRLILIVFIQIDCNV